MAGLIDQMDDTLAIGDIRHPHLPAMIERSQADQRDGLFEFDRSGRHQAFGSRRVADRDAGIFTHDMGTQQRAGRAIGQDDPATLDQQHRLDNGIQRLGEQGR